MPPAPRKRIVAPVHPTRARRERVQALRDRGSARTAAEQRELLDLLADVLLAQPGE